MIGNTDPEMQIKYRNLFRNTLVRHLALQLNPVMISSNQSADRKVFSSGKEYLFFSGTSYLGINNDKDFRALVEQGMDAYGTNYSTSRKSNLQLKIFTEAEEKLARQAGSAAALTLSSGFMAGQLVIRALEHTGYFHYAPDTHPAVWLSSDNFYHADFQAWSASISDKIRRSPAATHIILSNSVDPLTANAYSFEWINDQPKDKQIILVVDDSHGMGILNEGRGIYPAIPQADHVETIVVASIGKAMGLPGGAIFGSRERIARFSTSPWFSTSSPMSPAYLHAYMQADNVYRNAWLRLMDNIRQFTEDPITGRMFSSIPGYPVFYCPHNELYDFLLSRQILISSFAYPSPEDEPVTRIILNSHHTAEDIRELLKALYAFESATGISQ